MFKIKDGCKLQLQTLETMKLFGSKTKTKKILIDKTKNAEKVTILQLDEVVFTAQKMKFCIKNFFSECD